MFLRDLAAGACLCAAVLAALLLSGFTLDTDAHALEQHSRADPGQRIRLLHAAHTAHPRDTAISLALGLELERTGDFDRAEQTLLHAARYDRHCLPAWTLANFYFRQNNAPRFWEWAAVAAARNPGDFRPLLQLANHREPDPAVLLTHLGHRPELLRAYLDLLIADQRWEATHTVSDALRQHRDPTDLPRFEAVARLIPPSQRQE